MKTEIIVSAVIVSLYVLSHLVTFLWLVCHFCFNTEVGIKHNNAVEVFQKGVIKEFELPTYDIAVKNSFAISNIPADINNASHLHEVIIHDVVSQHCVKRDFSGGGQITPPQAQEAQPPSAQPPSNPGTAQDRLMAA